MIEQEPHSESVQHVDFGGYYLTHAIWHNSYGSYQPETGVRTRANGLKDFRLIQHGSDNWPMVTIVTLAGLSKGWDEWRIANVIGWLHSRERKRKTLARFAKRHSQFVPRYLLHSDALEN